MSVVHAHRRIEIEGTVAPCCTSHSPGSLVLLCCLSAITEPSCITITMSVHQYPELPNATAHARRRSIAQTGSPVSNQQSAISNLDQCSCLRIMQSSRHSHHWRRRRRRRRKLNLSILNTVTGLDVSRSGVVASCPRAPVLQSKLDPFIASATRMLQAAAAPGSVRNANANERVLSTQWLRCTCIFIAHGFALWSRRLPEVEGAPDHFSNHLVGHVIAANISTIQSSRRWSHSASRI